MLMECMAVPLQIWGSMTMTVFSQRCPLPDKVTNDASGNEIVNERVVKQGIENELECSLKMNLMTARIMHKWLGTAIARTEAIQQGRSLNNFMETTEKCN